MATKESRSVSASAVREANNRIVGESALRKAVTGRYLTAADEVRGFSTGKTPVTFVLRLSSDKISSAGERAMTKHRKKP